MAEKHDKSISLKALVDKKNNRVIYVESDADFVDILFSFLTIPTGTIIGLSHKHPPAVGIGCMNNLYKSVEKFDEQLLWTEACKLMLLYPRNGAEEHCKSLKVKFDYGEPTANFRCGKCYPKYLSRYRNAVCDCGEPITYKKNLVQPKKMSFAAQDGGVFVKGPNRFIISDDLQVMPLSSAASFYVISELGIKDGNTIEEKIFNVGEEEVLNLLMCWLVSKTPLSDTLLKRDPVTQLSKKIKILAKEALFDKEEDGKICVRLMVSKSRKIVCYAEAREDFVNLLFSYLPVPLGYIAKEMQGGSEKRCIEYLYKSVQYLDEQYFKSDRHKEMLTSPNFAPDFICENHSLGIEEATHQQYYCVLYGSQLALTTDDNSAASNGKASSLEIRDPKSSNKKREIGGGFVAGPAMFTVTDNLIITPISPILGLSVLNKLKVPFSDIEERIVHVGKEEAVRLLVASFVSECALTDTFIVKEPKQEQQENLGSSCMDFLTALLQKKLFSA